MVTTSGFKVKIKTVKISHHVSQEQAGLAKWLKQDLVAPKEGKWHHRRLGG
jgi:hypothetical protein